MSLALTAAELLADNEFVVVPGRAEVLEIRGDAAKSFLQGQMSQNVEELQVGDTTWTLLLHPQGKVCSWGRLYRHAFDTFWFLTDMGFAKNAFDRLDRFKLNLEIAMSLKSFQTLAIRGPNSLKSLEVVEEIVGGTQANIEFSRNGLVGLDLLLSHDNAFDVSELEQAGLPIGTPDLLELLRIRSGIASMVSELDDNTIPASAGIVADSVDFNKGCYVGQELVARINSRGADTPLRLAKFGSRVGSLMANKQDSSSVARAQSWPRPSDLTDQRLSLISNDAEVGFLTSVAKPTDSGNVALGFVKRGVDFVDPQVIKYQAAEGTVRQFVCSVVRV